MLKEAVVFRVALIISTAVHIGIGGFGLMWRDRHPVFGPGEGNIIVFEMGWMETKRIDAEDKGESPLASIPVCSNGNSGSAKENMGGVSNEYLMEVRRCIEKARSYPMEARRRLITGGVTVSFYIDCDGNPDDIRIVKSSGSSILDNTAKEMILRAGPFPKPSVKKYIQTTIVFKL